MTKAHVPPQVAGYRGRVTCATVRVHNNVRSIGRLAAGGMWMRGFCGDCNSLAGLNYDSAYGDFAKALDTYQRARSLLHLPRAAPAPPVRVAPGRVARSILIGMFATTPQLRVMFPGLAIDLRERRDHIALPDGASLRMALYPLRWARLASMFNNYRVLGRSLYYNVFSEVYFRPLAWALIPSDRGHTAELVDALHRESPEFAGLWRERPVLGPYCASKRFRHPQVGELELHCQTLVDPDQSQRLLVYTAVPGTESHTSLRLLSVLGQILPGLTAAH